MDIKLIILVVISSAFAADFDPHSLPPANVANVFHESGITFVSPSRTNLVPSTNNLVPTTSLLPPPIPITHAFGFVSHNSNNPQELVRTHSFQPVSHGFHSSVSAVRPHTTENERAHDDHSTHNLHVSVPVSLPDDNLHVRFREHENNFEFNVPSTTTAPVAHTTQFELSPQFHSTYAVPDEKPSPIHTTYGVPESVDVPFHVLSEEELNSLPVFQNDKFLSPIVRHTSTPTHGHLHLPSISNTIYSNPRFT